MNEYILGTWNNSEGEAVWEIYKLDEDTYGMILTTDSMPAMFKVHMLELSGHYFMDFYPEDFEIPVEEEEEKWLDLDFNFGTTSYPCINDFLSIHLFPVHTFARLEIGKDQITFRRFDMDWLYKLFEQNKIRIAHEQTEDNILLTATTDELQAFVSKYADAKEAYLEPEILVRAGN